MVKNNKLVIFCPFVNREYKNHWGDVLKLEGTSDVPQYYSNKQSDENFLPDKSQWWANGNIICTVSTDREESELIGPQWWGDHFLFPLLDMLTETCNKRSVPDCEFFLNKRDYPQLKFNSTLGVPVEPYGFIFDKDDRDPEQDIPLTGEHVYRSYAPVLSFYSSERFADIPIPPSEDW